MMVRPLSIALQKKAEDELNEVPSRVQQDLRYIKEWISKQDHLKARTDDQWLLSFLRSCKFSYQKVKQKLDLFYTMRTAAPELFTKRDPFHPDIQRVLSAGIVLLLPETASETSPKIMIFRCSQADPDHIDIASFTKTMFMILDILYMEDDSCVVSGLTGIMDLKNIPYKYLQQLTPSYLKKVVVCYQEAYPTRLKGLHVINAPSFIETVFKVIKSFLSEKLKERVKIYPDMEDVYKSIPQSILPEDFGGSGLSCKELTAFWKAKVESYRKWFLNDMAFGTDEAKRTESKIGLLGMEGSFRRLEID